MNSKEFSLKIECIVKEKRISDMDAVVWYCEQNGLDTSQVSSLISKSLIKKDLYDKDIVHYSAEKMLEECRKGPHFDPKFIFYKTSSFFSNFYIFLNCIFRGIVSVNSYPMHVS